jgi:hypothetical protein
MKEYRRNNKEKIKEYRENNKEKVAEKDRLYREANKEKIKEYNKRYNKDNKESRRERRIRNKEKIKLYLESNKEKIKEVRRLYIKKRLEADPKYKLDQNIRTAICNDLKKRSILKDRKNWEKLVGYTLQQLIEHLEKQFDEQMTWDNQGSYWHIDHIKPKSLFQYSDFDNEEFKKCWALENLQPLEGKENIRKSNKYKEEENG